MNQLKHKFNCTEFTHLFFNGEDYIYLSGYNNDDNTFYIARAYPDNLIDLGGYTSQPISWVNITTDYHIQSLASVTPLTYVPITVTIDNSPSYQSYDPSQSFTNIIEYTSALFNDGFTERVRSNTVIILQFEYACSHHLETLTTFAFQLQGFGSQPRPIWANFNSTSKTLTLSTPNVTEPKDYEFALQTSFNSKSYLKEFRVTVVPCLISN